MRLKKFEYLPHTADVMFVAYGKDYGEVIENAASAMLNVMLDTRKVKRSRNPAKRLAIKEKADTIENLVWYVLQDILTKIDAGERGAFEFKVSSVKELKAGIAASGSLGYKSGVPDCFLTEVKAVTPYGMEVRKADGIYSIEVVLDV
jgi:SHS2 domain-containing protein